VAAFAQQTGSIQGKVIDASGAVLPGVTIEAKSNVLPTPRTTVSGSDGAYQMPALPPGHYTVTFTLSGFQTVTREADVQLQQVTPIDAKLAVQGVTEAVTVTAETTFADRTSAQISSGLNNVEVSKLPVGTQYRDLINLIPGVMYTQDLTRGPSAGASGQDNVYKYDGVNVTLPLFGTLSAEPSAADIAEFTVVKGGARAVDFNRAGGFDIDSVSKSGTNAFHGEASYRFQRSAMAAGLVNTNNNTIAAKYDQNRDFTDANLGGPVVPNKAFFFASYYRPTQNRRNAATAYGPVPNFDSVRNEGFGKVTLTPTPSTLVNVSYRDSHRLDKGSQFGATTAPTAGTGNEAWQRIATADGSWIIKNNSVLSFKYTHFALPTQGRPDNVSSAVINTTPGTRLDIANLDKLGLFTVPKPISGNPDQNAFVAPIVNQYGFIDPTTGQRTGGGTVGFGATFDKDDFYRNAGQVQFNTTLMAMGMRHNLHGGFQAYVDSEDFDRTSNGWGSINVPAGTASFQGIPIFYQTTYQAQGVGIAPVIHSEYHSKSFEANDTVNWKNWTFNAGAVISNDTIYGQGLKADSTALSGFVKPGPNDTTPESRKYQAYNIPWSKMIQPRVSATWAYNDKDTIFASYGRFNPAASSLPRAASWDRGLEVTQNADFDANGNLFAVESVASSTGKLFVPNMTPRRYDEFLVGTAKQFNPTLSGRAYFRYRKGTHFWEDTPNQTRQLWAEGHTTVPGTNAAIPNQPYIANLADQLAQIGTGGNQNSYVIADLDGSFTDYRELTLESEYRKGRAWVQGSFTWSRYYGNFDQDGSSSIVGSTSTDNNDSNIFIGSSFIGDGPGRQLWDNKLGYLRGDRPYVFKLLGTYNLSWKASLGAFVTAQSGQPWETHSYLPYGSITGSTSNTARYAEPAGSHRSDPHAQLDLNYTQDIPFLQRYRGSVVFYVYNVFNSQTGYSIDPNFNDALYGQPLRFYDPRRLEMTVRLQF